MSGNSKIPLSIPHLNGKELEYIKAAIDSTWVTMGPFVDRFEEGLGKVAGTSHVVAMSCGTAAIHVALRLLGVGPGDTVFCPSLTFIATANPILYLGAKPVFIDSSPEDWNLSPLALQNALEDAKKKGKLPKAVLVVDLFGQAADYDKIIPICDSYGVPVIEDAAEALGSSYNGKPCGSFGKFGVLSFNGNKIMTTSGGGALCVHDAATAKRAKYMITQARESAEWYEHTEVGYNYRLSNILAAMGVAQLETLSDHMKARQEIASRYEKAFSDFPAVRMMPKPAGRTNNHWLSTISLDPKYTRKTVSSLIQYMAGLGIELRHVWKPLHLQPVFKGTDYYPHSNDCSKEIFEQSVCIPSWSGMKVNEQDRVCAELKKFLKS